MRESTKSQIRVDIYNALNDWLEKPDESASLAKVITDLENIAEKRSAERIVESLEEIATMIEATNPDRADQVVSASWLKAWASMWKLRARR